MQCYVYYAYGANGTCFLDTLGDNIQECEEWLRERLNKPESEVVKKLEI